MGVPHLLAHVIKAKRQRLELSARQASALSRLSPSYIARVERGEVAAGGMTLSTFAAVARVLHFTDQEILFVIRNGAIEHFSPIDEPAPSTGTDG